MRIKNLFWATSCYLVLLPILQLNAQGPPPASGTPPPSPVPVLDQVKRLAAHPTPTPPVALPQPPYAVVTYQPNVSVVAPCPEGIFQVVGVQPDQVVQVTIQYPSGQALQVVTIVPLDGGSVIPPNPDPDTSAVSGSSVSPGLLRAIPLPTDQNGALTFVFQAGHDPGVNQVSLRNGSQELGLQFWVFDPNNPDINPPTLNPDNPGVQQ